MDTDSIPTDVDELYRIIDHLWGELPVDCVIELVDQAPEIVEVCKEIHEHVWHEGGSDETVRP